MCGRAESLPGGGQTGLWVSGWARWGVGVSCPHGGLVEGVSRPSLGGQSRSSREMVKDAESCVLTAVQLAVRRLEEEFPLQWVPLVLQLLGDCL